MDRDAADVVALVAAVALAVVFLIAALAKLRAPEPTTADFRSLGLPRPDAMARIIPLVELATAATLLVAPGWGGVIAFVILAAFTATLAVVIRSGRVVSCACFGGTSSEPISVRHLLRNAALLIMALTAATFGGFSWQL